MPPSNQSHKAHVYNGASLASDRSQGIIATKIRPGSRVLELGPGSGVLTRHLAEQMACVVTIVESDPSACDVLSPYVKQAINADIEDDAWLSACENTPFDVIVCADVLEHLQNPWLTLEKVIGLLAAGGLVIISIPNIGHSAVLIDLYNDRFTYRRWGILDDSHLRFFTREGVMTLLTKAGLQPSSIGATYRLPEQTEFGNSYLDVPFTVALKLAKRPSSHVFQYIVTAKRAEDMDASLEPEDHINPPSYGFRQHLFRFGHYIYSRLSHRANAILSR